MKILKTQSEILSSWGINHDEPVVSICCTTYNHEPYIEDALEGFLTQETDFPFEILINDDASTDRTSDIIREYEAKYPMLIKPIYQVNNQYSKGKKMNIEFNFPRAKGEYIAFCEGDDYWVSTDKLQRQVNVHKRHKNLSISCHHAIERNIKDNSEKIIFMVDEEDKLMKSAEIITRKYGSMPTASMMITARYLQDIEFFFRHVSPPVGDYFIQIFMALHGEVYYLNSIKSVYRKNISGSWSEGQLDTYKNEKHSREMIESLRRAWGYLMTRPDASYIGVPWASYTVSLARYSSSKFSGVLVIFMMSPKLRLGSFTLLLKYYRRVLQKLLKKYRILGST